MFDRSYVKGILPQRLEAYMQEAEQDLKVTEINLKDKTLSRSALGAKWCRYSFEEERFKKKLLDSLDDLREEIKQKLFEQKKIAITSNQANDKLINLQVEKYLVNTTEYKELQDKIKEQEDIIRLIMEIQKQVSMFGYDLTNIKEIIKLENI